MYKVREDWGGGEKGRKRIQVFNVFTMIMATECFERMKPGFESYL